MKKAINYRLQITNYIATAAISAMLLVFLPTQVQATEYVGGELIKGSSDAVYYVGTNLKRYVFPNERVFMTWYQDFGEVTRVTDTELNNLPLAGVVRYKPGVRMIKIPDDPKVYTVGQMGLVRHVENEEIATELYGANWNTYVDDMLASFFVSSYTVGSAVTEATQFDPATQTAAAISISVDFGLVLPAEPAEQPIDEPEPEPVIIALSNITDIEYAPSNSDIVYFVSGDAAVGAWKSVDGGSTWSQVYSNLSFDDIAIHTANPDTVLLVGNGVVYRTEDGGVSWSLADLPTGIGAVEVATFASVNDDLVYALTPTWLIESSDAGATWSTASSPLSQAQTWSFTSAFGVHPTDDSTLIVGSSRGVQQTDESGDTWTQKKPPVAATELSIISLDFHPTDPGIYYVTTEQGFWYTADNGSSWNATRVPGVADNELHEVAVSYHDTNFVYVVTGQGIFKSTNRAVKWNAMNSGVNLLDVGSLAISPDDENKLLVGTSGQSDEVAGEGLYSSSDGGESWTYFSELTL